MKQKKAGTKQSWTFIGSILAFFLLLTVLLITKDTWSKKVDPTPVTPTVSVLPSTTVQIATPSVTTTTISTATPTKVPADKKVTSTNGAFVQFTSYDLGITFSYPKKGVTVKRVGTKVYVEDQYVEVFTKDKEKSLTEAMMSSFLTGYNPQDCFISDATKVYEYPSEYEEKTINTPPSSDLEEMDKKVALCPKTYTRSNGVSYFIASSTRKDRFAFLSIGQYAIAGKTESDTWQETLRLIAQ